MAKCEHEREIKKCPGCKHDFWRDELLASGYCTTCNRPRSRKSVAKHRREHRDEYNAYHRDYKLKTGRK